MIGSVIIIIRIKRHLLCSATVLGNLKVHQNRGSFCLTVLLRLRFVRNRMSRISLSHYVLIRLFMFTIDLREYGALFS